MKCYVKTEVLSNLMAAVIKRYALQLVFTLSLLLGLQLPHFLQQYETRLQGHFAEAQLQLAQFQSLADASEFIRVIEQRQDYKIGCIEEVAYRNGFINDEQLRIIAEPLVKSGYGKYLLRLLG